MPDGRESARRSVELNPFASRDDKVVAASLRFAYNTANISELQLYGILKYFFFYKQEWNKNRIFQTTHPIRINEDEGWQLKNLSLTKNKTSRSSDDDEIINKMGTMNNNSRLFIFYPFSFLKQAIMKDKSLC